MTVQEERLTAYLLELLDERERAEVDEALASDPAQRAELDALAELWHLGAEAEVTPLPPPPGGLARLLEATETVSRFDEFVAPLARLMDIALDKARELLGRLDDELAWDDSPMDWVKLMHLEPGPAAGVAMAGFLRVEPGKPFPDHTHGGFELVFILQGGLQDSHGTVLRCGDQHKMGDGTQHSFVALDGAPLIYLFMAERGVEFDFPFDP